MQCYGRRLIEQCNLLQTDTVLLGIVAGTSNLTGLQVAQGALVKL